jgi:hypothetical protein
MDVSGYIDSLMAPFDPQKPELRPYVGQISTETGLVSMT